MRRCRRRRRVSTATVRKTTKVLRRWPRFKQTVRSCVRFTRVGRPGKACSGCGFITCRSSFISTTPPTSIRASVVCPVMAASTKWKWFISTKSCRWRGASSVTKTPILICVRKSLSPNSIGSHRRAGIKTPLPARCVPNKTFIPNGTARCVTAEPTCPVRWTIPHSLPANDLFNRR